MQLPAAKPFFVSAFTTVDDYGKFGSIASMIYSDGNSGWGEEYASSSLRAAMAPHPEDVRWSYIIPLSNGAGGCTKEKWYRGLLHQQILFPGRVAKFKLANYVQAIRTVPDTCRSRS
jgi:hypothetical protein